MKTILPITAALIVSALAGCSTAVGPSVDTAKAAEVHTTRGAYVGKLKFTEIPVGKTLLQINLPDDKINKVSAGWVGNSKSYREHFELPDGYIQYRQAGAGLNFYMSDFTADNVGPAIFTKRTIEFKSARKLGRRLIAVEGRSPDELGDCAGLVYAGVGASVVEPDLYNDWYLISVFCDFSLSQDELVASAAVRMAGVKKDGRRIVNLAKYNLPKPKP